MRCSPVQRDMLTSRAFRGIMHLGSIVLASEARGSRSRRGELTVRARLKALLPLLSGVHALPGLLALVLSVA